MSYYIKICKLTTALTGYFLSDEKDEEEIIYYQQVDNVNVASVAAAVNSTASTEGELSNCKVVWCVKNERGDRLLHTIRDNESAAKEALTESFDASQQGSHWEHWSYFGNRTTKILICEYEDTEE